MVVDRRREEGRRSREHSEPGDDREWSVIQRQVRRERGRGRRREHRARDSREEKPTEEAAEYFVHVVVVVVVVVVIVWRLFSGLKQK